MALAAPRPAPARLAESEGNTDEAAEETAAPATPVRLVGQLTFRSDPSQRYYLTTGLTVVRVGPDDTTEVVGRLTRTDSPNFPYVLVDGQQRHLFITAGGDVYNQQGQRVAKLSIG